MGRAQKSNTTGETGKKKKIVLWTRDKVQGPKPNILGHVRKAVEHFEGLTSDSTLFFRI
jgi:hypothetical protein